MRSALLLAVAVALALLAGCASPESRKVEATPYTPEPGPEARAWGVLVEEALRPADMALEVPNGPSAFALVRVEAGNRIIDPTAADVEALRRAEEAMQALGDPRPLTQGLPVVEGWPMVLLDLPGLRMEAARLGASRVMVARFDVQGRARRLTATLHDTASGRELSRYGPGEPSLTLAAHHLGRALH